MTERVNPEMLVVARESRGLTQPELSRRLNIAQSTISKIENGLAVPSDDVLGLYSKELGYPVSFFFEPLPPRRLPVTFYRKRKSVGNPALRTADAQMTVLRLHLQTLLRPVEKPPVSVPAVSLEQHGYSAADLAREMRIKWKVPDGPIENVVKLLEDHGIFVIKWRFQNPAIDGLSIYDEDHGLPPIVVLDPSFPGDRLRFSAAHELAHILMHHHQPLPGPRAEEEADEFASEFLMPSAEIGPFLRGVSIDRLANLKAHWRVSMQSILMRAGDLGAISESQKRRLWSTMNSLGFMRSEPVEIPPEDPTLVKELVEYHLTNLDYSLHDVAGAVRSDFDEFKRTYLADSKAERLRLVK